MNAPMTYYKWDEDDKNWVAMGNASKGEAQGKGVDPRLAKGLGKGASAGSAGHAQPPPSLVGPNVKRRKLLKDMRITLEHCAMGGSTCRRYSCGVQRGLQRGSRQLQGRERGAQGDGEGAVR